MTDDGYKGLIYNSLTSDQIMLAMVGWGMLAMDEVCEQVSKFYTDETQKEWVLGQVV